MKDATLSSVEPTEKLMQAWIYQASWTTRDALVLALGASPDDEMAEAHLEPLKSLLERAIREGLRSAAPIDWLWWGERNGMPFHSAWWTAITPQGPIGFDGQHFALLREEMLSDAYLQQERRLITKWARKPYWTSREAIDLSLNYDPFTTDGWRGEEPEFGGTIREREDRFLMLERAVEAGDISEKAAPKDYVEWLDKCGYIVSEAWRRALGLELKENESLGADQVKNLAEENAQLKLELVGHEKKVSELEQLIEHLSPLREEVENLRRELEGRHEFRLEPDQTASEDGTRRNQTKMIAELRKRIRLLQGETANHSEVSALTRRVNLLEIALLSAAVDGHSYDPRAGKSPVHRQIADKAAELGHSLSVGTVREYLRLSSDAHVEPDVWNTIYPLKI